MTTDPQNTPPESQTEEIAAETGAETAGGADGGGADESQGGGGRKIRIGSQRDTTPRSPAYRTPPGGRPAGMVKPSAVPATEVEVPATQPPQVPATEAEVPATEPPQIPTEAPAVESQPASSQAREARGFRSEDLDSETPPPPSVPVSAPRKGSVPVPSKRNISAELQAELDAALGDMAIEDLLEVAPAVAVESEALELETKLNARVLRLEGDNVFLALGGRNQGVVSVRQFAQPPEIGAILEVIVGSFNAEDGLYEVTVPGASIDVRDWADLHEGAVVEARITGHNTGGLECEVNNLRGFIPISQVSLYRVEDLSEFVGQKYSCVVMEANPERRNLVLSRRAMLERERESQRAELLAALEPGQLVEGTVRSIREFGVFVDLGGIDGLIHISQLSWDHVDDASTVLREGQKVKVKIQKIDPTTGKISLSYRATQENPWSRAAEKYPVGSLVRGPVSRIAKFGAFVRLEAGVEGLIHISELAHHRVSRVDTVVREGQEVEVKVLSVDTESQRISLSLKATLAAPVDPKAKKAAEEEDVDRELAVKPRSGPLKGGRDRESGGEQFGLNW